MTVRGRAVRGGAEGAAERGAAEGGARDRAMIRNMITNNNKQ